jgi:hypothetical protein
MKHFVLALALLSGTVAVATTPTRAAEEGMALSFANKDADSEVAESIAAMQAWAEGEYEEHKGEGLFTKHPSEGQLIQDMLAVSKELLAKAEAAKTAGDTAKSHAYYYSAEATAQYAARMPHMLEHRIK